MLYQAEFPTVEHLWRGAILGGILEAVAQLRTESEFIDRSWAGNTYISDTYQGQRAVIAFNGLECIGLAFDRDSPRNPYPPGVDIDHLPPFLSRIPYNLWIIAQTEVLPFTRISDLPVFTAAFWSEGTEISASEPWSEVITHGAWSLALELLPIDEALGRAVQQDYEFVIPKRLIPIIRSIHERRIRSRSQEVHIEPIERRALMARGSGDSELARSLFEEMNIIL